jgi:hypothetical protein
VITVIECYPDLIRYIELEIDVVKNTGESARIIENKQTDPTIRAKIDCSRITKHCAGNSSSVSRIVKFSC